MSLGLAMPTLSPGSVSGRPLDAGYPLASTRTILAFRETLDVSHRFQSELFTEWTLGFRQSSFHHAVRVSTGGSLDGFTTPRLSEHATFPFRFRVQVGPVTQGYHAQPLPSYPGIIHAAMRRTPRQLWITLYGSG